MDTDYSLLCQIFGSKMKADEIVLLLADSKQVVRQGFYEHELQNIKDFCSKNGFFCCISTFKVAVTDTTLFSNQGELLAADDKRSGMFFVYLSKDEEFALRAQYAEQIGDQKTLGVLLGYPLCCVEYFCQVFSVENSNPLQQEAHGLLDLRKREQDIVLISHFPCSNGCTKSKKRARETLRILDGYAPLRAKELRESLEI